MRTLTSILTASALGSALVVAPALAQQQNNAQQKQDRQGSAQSAGQQRSAPSRIVVASADSLTDRAVTTSDGKKAGDVSFVMIDMADGNVPYLIVGGRADADVDLGGRYVAVPWAAVKPGSLRVTGDEDRDDSPIRLDVTLSQVQQAERYAAEDLYRLTAPNEMRRVYGAWGYELRPVYGYGYGYPYEGYYGPAYYGGRPHILAPVVGNGQQQSGQQSSNGQQQSAQQAGQEQQSGSADAQNAGRGARWVLVDPYGYKNLAGPQPARAVTDMQVRLPDGHEADIDRVMIDVDHGHVAYVLLSVGGFLGIGNKLMPVPIEALSWAADNDDYSLVLDRNRLMRVPVVPDTEAPHVVSGQDLASLYNAYGVKPYWR
jgi:sporulation protein YlmC with PRC-barrel domain